MTTLGRKCHTRAPRSHERLCVICFVVWQKKTNKNKQNVNKNAEYILRLHLVNVTWPLRGHPGWHYNVTWVTVKRWTYDNAQRHVMAFRPISEAARCWSCDNQMWWPSVENVALGLCPHTTFSTEGPSYLDVRLTTMHPLYNVMCVLVICMTYLPPSVYVVYGSFTELAW